MIRWRVGTKIISIGGIVMAAFALITIFIVAMNMRVDRLMTSDQAATTMVELSAKTRDSFLKARITERTFNDRPSAKGADTVKQLVADARKYLEQMAATSAGRDKQEAEAALAAIDDYAKRFESFRSLWEKLGYDENSGLQGSLRKAVREIETSLTAGTEDKLLAQMLTLRRHEKDFILRRDRSYIERFNKSADDFRSSLDRGGHTAQLPLLETYRREFGVFADSTLQVSAANQALETAGTAVLEQIDALFTQNLQEMNDIRTAVADLRSSSGTGTIAGMLAVALISLGVAFVIGRGIGGPLGKMTNLMTALAAGDLSHQVPEVNRSDEVADMAKALTVFKRNSEEKARLDAAERERLDREQRELTEARERDERVSRQIADFCSAIGNGALDRRVDTANLQGVFRDMGQQMNGLATTLQGVVGEVAGVMGSMARGDLTVSMAGNYQGVFGDLKQSSNQVISTLREFAQRLAESAETVKTASAEISTGSLDLASRTESQAASIEETAASMHEITETVKQNSDNAQAATQLAVVARDTAAKGGSVVAEAVTAVNQIEESARKIGDIVSLIDEIAFQTNLLALNASVEAARAGEAGKGFAVVAQEVRALAQRSANASKDIKALITESNAQVKAGASLVNQTGQSLTDIVAAVKKVTDIVSEIAAASKEQATGLDQVNTAVVSMDEMTQRNGALVEETSASAQQLAQQANDLSQLVGFFKTAA